MSQVQTRPVAGDRSGWRAVTVPSEHGGWGLTLEPVLLGLLIAWSSAGVALGVAAFAAFLLRTPAKLVAVDVRRGRWLDRTGRALRVAIVEAAVLVASVAVAVAFAGWSWLVPVLVAAPLIAIEFSFDIRSRGRRLIPELCGATGICAVAAAIVLAGGLDGRLAAGVWIVLAARSIGAIPFVRVRIGQLRHGHAAVWQSDLAQALAAGAAVVAVVVERQMLLGAAGVVALAVAQVVWVRCRAMPAKQLGIRQMVLGLVLVLVTAAGVWW